MDRVRRPSPGRAAAVGALFIGMLLALGMTPVAAEAATSTSKVQIVLENPDFSTLAVDRQGRSYGVNTNASAAGGKYRLYRSGDEGRTWAPTHDFPASTRIYGLSVLSSGTLLLHLVDTDFYLYRSSDAGQTWTQVLHFPLLYETLTAHSVTDDGAYAYAGSYNVLDSSVHDNWIWRSADDGRTWQIIRTTNTHRHIHAVQVDPSSGALYALYGDSGAQVAIERSNDHGASWQTVCSGTPCVAVDISFDGAGHAIFGQDAPRGGAQIQRLDLADGKTTSVLAIPGASYSALNLNGTFLVGTSREPNGSYPANDPNVHLYGSADGGATFSEYFTIPWQNPNSYVNLLVQHAFPNGDFVIQVDGYGTIVARLAAPGPPPPAPPPSGGGGAPAPPTPPPVAVTPPVVSPPVVSPPAVTPPVLTPPVPRSPRILVTAPKLTHHRPAGATTLRARRSGSVAVVSTAIAVDKQATIALTARDPRTGKQLALRIGTRLGATTLSGPVSTTGAAGRAPRRVTARIASAGVFTVKVVLKGSRLTRGVVYELRLVATGTTGKTDRLDISLRA